MLARDVVDQLLDQHRLADAGAAEEADLAAADVRRDQVDHLDARLEDLQLRGQLAERRRIAVDRPALAGRGFLAVDGIADHVPHAAERLVADGNRDRLARVDDLRAAREAVGGVHRDRADAVVAEMLLHLRDQLRRAAACDGHLDAERVVDLGQPAGKTASRTTPLISTILPMLPPFVVGHGSPEGVAGREGRRATERLPERGQSIGSDFGRPPERIAPSRADRGPDCECATTGELVARQHRDDTALEHCTSGHCRRSTPRSPWHDRACRSDRDRAEPGCRVRPQPRTAATAALTCRTRIAGLRRQRALR